MKNHISGIRFFSVCLLFLLIRTTCVAQVKAGFTSSVKSGCVPLVVQFNDASTGGPTGYAWDFGNGTASQETNPATIYDVPGSYTVKLVVKNSAGTTDSVTKVDYITVYPKPVADFNGVPTGGCAPLPVQFSDNSSTPSGNIAQWTWDFGDGQVSTDQNPLHTYTTIDTFTISLTVSNNFGCSNFAEKPAFISVNGVINADFDYTYTNACSPPTKVNFNNSDNSASSGISYQWIFGDGGTSSKQSPSYTYNANGKYNVQLIASTAQGCRDTVTKSISIGTVAPDFRLPDAGCAGKKATFIDSSSPSPISLNWTFGDGGTGTGLRPIHLYNSPGQYNVKMVANFGSCTDSITKVFVVKDDPTAAFSSTGDRTSCKLPVDIQFTSNSTNTVTFMWNFGDGTKSTEQNPLHRYTKQGFYSVTLIAINSNGCSDTLVMPNYIKVGPPKIDSLLNAPFRGCVPTAFNFDAAITSSEAITSYAWDFGDGTTGTGSSPSHSYGVAGYYSIKLTASTNSGCSGTAVFPNIVGVGNKPTAKFSGTPTNGCSADSVKFNDQSTGAITYREWTFGDGSVSDTSLNTLHKYTDTGYFTVTLSVQSYGCTSTLVQTNYIHIKPPVARFNYNYTCGQGTVRNFTDSSIGAQKWAWNFGDGGTSATPSPSHTYSKAGKYAVTLTVTNGACTGVQTDSLVVLSGTATFAYSPNKTGICKNDSIKFKVTNFDPRYVGYFLWDFGNGSKVKGGLNDSLVKYAYTQTGTYTPTLTIKDILGCTTAATGNPTLKVYAPTANFARLLASCANAPVVQNERSTDDGTHPIKKWTWYYGDGTVDVSTAPPFQHTYTAAGIYTVKLIVQDSYGCIDSSIRKSADTVSNPVANFGLPDSIRCTNSPASFLDSSQGPGLAYAWDFGDNTSSALQFPQHLYKKTGAYTVSLIISDKYGCKDTLTRPNYVIIANPIASFNLTDTVGFCPPLKITPKSTAKNVTFLTWDFGDGNSSNLANPEHIYTLADSYQLLLIIQGHGNCADTAHKTIVVHGPAGSFKYTPDVACTPAPVSFSAAGHSIVGYQWIFGDGKIETTTGKSIGHTYKVPGMYLPKLLIVDSAGCQVQLENDPDSIRVAGVTALFGASTLPGCDSAVVSITDSSEVFFDTLQSRVWNFGDGTPSVTDANPEHWYFNSGNKNITLSLTTNLGCSSVYKLPVNVTVHQSPVLQASIPSSICINTPAAFTASNSSVPQGTLTWQWQFGNGDISAAQNPTYTYAAAGSFTAAVTGVNEFGCSDSVQGTVTVNAVPAVDAGRDSIICLGQSVTLQPTGADGYVWANSASLSCTNCANPVAKPGATTRYYVTGTSAVGCTAQDSVLLEVKTPFTLVLPPSDSICKGASIQIGATGAEEYNWQPSTGVSDASSASPVVSPAVTTTYTVTGSDVKKCFTSSASIVVNVFTNPSVNLVDSAVTITVGGKYVPVSTTSPDVTKWQWTPPAGLSCSDCAQPVASPKQATTYQEKVTNQYGCSATDNVTVQVLCNQNALFIPNTFSPNGDGANDYFYPRGVGLYTIKALRIFNRWGQIVFEKVNFAANDQSAAWDGRYKGKPQPADVYVYAIDVICDNGTVITTKGDVTLLR